MDDATADGTALAGSDYTTASGTLTLDPGVTSQTLTVSVLGDMATETDETFSPALTNRQHVTPPGSAPTITAAPAISVTALNANHSFPSTRATP